MTDDRKTPSSKEEAKRIKEAMAQKQSLADIGSRIASETGKSVKNSIKDVNTSIVKSISKVTISPLKEAVSPQGLGLAASRVAGNNPLVGTVVEGSISKIGESLGSLFSIIRDQKTQDIGEPQSDELIQDIKDNLPTIEDNSEIKDLLMQLVHINEIQLSTEQKAMLERERNELKALETERELNRVQERQLDLFENLIGTIEGEQQPDKKGGGFTFSKLFGANFLSNISSGLVASMAVAFKKLPFILAKGITKSAFAIFKPLAFIKGFTEGFKEWKDGGGIEDIIGAFAGGIIEIFSFGLIDADKSKKILSNIFNVITDRIGQTIFSIATFDVGSAKDKIDESLNNVVNSIKDIIINSSIVKSVKEMIADLQNMFNSIISAIPFVMSPEEKKEKLTQEKNILEKQQKDIQNQKQNVMNADIPVSGLDKIFGITSEDKKREMLLRLNQRETEIKSNLNRLDGEIKSFNTGGIVTSTTFARVGEGADEAIIPIHRLDDLVVVPAIKKTLGFLQAQQENTKLKEQALGKSLGNSVIAPVTNNVVTQQQATPFIAPKTKRNNENTFQRMSDLNHNSKLI